MKEDGGQPEQTPIPSKRRFFAKILGFIVLLLLALGVGYTMGSTSQVLKSKELTSASDNSESKTDLINDPNYRYYADTACGVSFLAPKEWAISEENQFGGRVIAAPGYEYIGALSVGDADNFRGSAIAVSCNTINDFGRSPEEYVAFQESLAISGTIRKERIQLANNPALLLQTSGVQTIEGAKIVNYISITMVRKAKVYDIRIETTELDNTTLNEISSHLVESFVFN